MHKSEFFECMYEYNMRLGYLDDEDNWINLNNDDDRGFQEFWQSARTVPEREFKRIKVKAGVLGYLIPRGIK